LVALLRHILGDNGSGDYRDILIANAITAARDILKSQKSDRVINDEIGGGNETYVATLDGVKAWLKRPDPVMGDSKREKIDALNALDSDAQDDAVLAGEELWSVVSDCTNSGVLVGAALMFGILKGGAR
jgi:hypothetical protein